MRRLYWVKRLPSGSALMLGEDMLYVATQTIARRDAREFNKAAQQSVKRTAKKPRKVSNPEYDHMCEALGEF